MKIKEHNIYIYILYKVLLAFGALVAMQILFLIANRHIFRPEGFAEWTGILWGNVVFGIATIGAFFLPYCLLMLIPSNIRWKKWYRAVAETLYILPMLVILVSRAADTAYYQYTYRMLSNEIFTYLGNSGPMDKLIPHFMVNYWYAWVFGILIITAFFIINHRIRLAACTSCPRMTKDLVGLGVGLLVMWFMARGGFGHFIRLDDAANYCQPKNIPVVSNSGYNILRTLFVPQLEEKNFMSQEEALALFNPESQSNGPGLYQGRNVVLIIVESFGQEYAGCYNPNGEDTRTPFLDSLAQHATLYQGRANGKRSIEGITAINTGIPTLMNVPFVNCSYRNDSITGLPNILKTQGYHTAFFHGSMNGVMDFDKLCYRVGYDEYLGLDEFKAEGRSREEDFDGVWGVYDEPFLQYVVRHTSDFKEPFLTTVFTVTSHDPFPMPEKYKERFVEGRHPILKDVEYMDNALRQFFDEARKQSWYNNTLFIITADHSGPGISPEYNDYDGWYRIPFIVYDPQQETGRVESRILQQTDILPTLADWLGCDSKLVTFGQSAAKHPGYGWQIYFGNDYYCMVSNNYTSPQMHDITVVSGKHEIGKEENIRMLKAVVQQYFDRVINDELMVK